MGQDSQTEVMQYLLFFALVLKLSALKAYPCFHKVKEFLVLVALWGSTAILLNVLCPGSILLAKFELGFLSFPKAEILRYWMKKENRANE